MFLSVAAGDAFVCARSVDGAVWCWGDNREGELGGASTEPFVATPTRVPGLDGVVQVAAARHWAAAVRRDGTVWTWGRDGWGLRTGDPARFVRQGPPTQVEGLDRVVQLALGELHGCALRDDGSVWCWGSDQDGRLGDAPRFVATLPPSVPGVPGGPWLPPGSPPGGPPGGLALPGSPPPPTPAPTDPRRDPAFAPAPVPGLTGATAIAAFGERSAAVIDGRVWLWGVAAARVAREWGELGARPVRAEEVAPRLLEGPSDLASVSLHADHLLAVTTDGALWGSGAVRTWWPAPARPPGPAAESLTRFPELEGVVEAVAFQGAAVRLADGTIRAWAGAHTRGDGATEPSPPSRLALRARSLAAGREFLCAVDVDGAVWCWGAGWAGQLGPDGGHPIGESAYWFADRPVRVLPAGQNWK